MAFTRNPITDASAICNKIWSTLGQNGGTNVVYVPDGTIFAELPNGNGISTTYQINKTCCDILKRRLVSQNQLIINGLSPQSIYFDLNEQKCRWSKTGCDTVENTPIKVVLNPNGNDGVLFTYGDDEICRLDISFDYLIKFNCDKLSSFATTANKNVNNLGLKILRQEKFELESNVLDLDNQLSGLALEDVNTNYSIVCDEFPVNITEVTNDATTVNLTETEKSIFSDSGFGSLVTPNSITSKVAPKYDTKQMTFCLTEAGLIVWQKLISNVNYTMFINGDPSSYTCKNVIDIYDLNEQAILNNQDILIYECTTPFGRKSQISKEVIDIANTKNLLLEKISVIDDNILIIEEDVNVCDTLLGQFQNIKLSMSLDKINDDGSTTSFDGREPIFGPFNTASELYQYLANHPNNSGFLLCGDNTSGCTPMVISEYSGVTSESPINSNSCNLIKDTLISQLSSVSTSATLSPNIFNSDWIPFNMSVTNPATLSGITGSKIKLNIIVNNSCGDFCILVDNINITRVCDDINRTNIYVSQSPGFDLTKVVDNKKSWNEAIDYTDRQFYIGRYDDTNKIRQTEYSVDEERLVLNSKEIDLTMNMASAIENDVWNYLLDNPNLLTGATSDCSNGFKPLDIYGNEITLPTVYTEPYYGCNWVPRLVNNTLLECLDNLQNNTCEACTLNYEECFPNLECTDCGKALKFSNTYMSNSAVWIVCENNNVSFYLIGDVDDTQNTITNITQCSVDGTVFLDLFNYVIFTINQTISENNLNIPQYENFWSDPSGKCSSCCTGCGDQKIDLTGFTTTNITEVNTLETFENLMVSELTDAKNRKVLSAYPTLRAVYDRYMNATQYGVPQSNEFTYDKMDKFTGLIKSYWDDLIEQVVPATTLWGSIKVYTNTMFDQQKFKYRSYSSLLCNSPLNFVSPPSPINGSNGQCQNVEVVVSYIQNLTEGDIVVSSEPSIYNNICLTQMNWGSEFIGNVDIQDINGNYLNNDNFCDNLCKKAVWYDMVTRPEYVMLATECPSPPSTAITWTINSFIINGVELVNTTITSTTVTTDNVIWVPAQNDIISGCTSGGTTGWTYTNFVDFLNYTFVTLGLYDYKAVVSKKEKSGIGQYCSKNGFYLVFPQNDIFSLEMNEIDNGYIITYANDGISDNVTNEYYCYSLDVDYNCIKNVIHE